jgi:VanZ family protein
LFLWLPVVVYVAFIFWLSSAPRAAPSFLDWPGGDKAFHTVEYAGLGALILRALNGSWPNGYRWLYLVLAGAIIAAVVGGLDEYVQQFTPTRSSSILDWSADLIGAMMGQTLYWLKVNNS